MRMIMNHSWVALLIALLGTCVFAAGQESKTADDIVREKQYVAGWDPDEPVPAYFYFKKGNANMPVVIFLHGMGGNKDQYGQRMQEWARKGLFVVVTDAHLHGERKV